MKKHLYFGTGLVLLVACVQSCSTAEERTYSRWGLEVAVPKGWAPTDETYVGNDSYYITFSQLDENSSGITSFSWSLGEVDLVKSVEPFKEVINEDFEDPTVRPLEKDYGEHETYSIEYSFTFEGTPYRVRIHAFHLANCTVNVLEQSVLTDSNVIAPDLAAFRKTFRLTDPTTLYNDDIGPLHRR